MLLTCYPRRGGRAPTRWGERGGPGAPGEPLRAGPALGARVAAASGRARLRALPVRSAQAPAPAGTVHALPARWGPSLARPARSLRAACTLSTSHLICLSVPVPAPTPQCRGLMSEECGRTAALAAGRTRKGAGEEGLVSGVVAQGKGPRSPSSFPGPTGPSGSGRKAGKSGKLSWRVAGRAVRLPGSSRSGVSGPRGCVARTWTWGREQEARLPEAGGGLREGRGGVGGAPVGRWDVRGRRGLETPCFTASFR